MFSKQLVLILCFFVLFCSLVEAELRCYSCNSYRDRNQSCYDPMDPKVTSIVCPANYACSKVSYITQNTLVMSRSCDSDVTNACTQIKSVLQSTYTDLSKFSCNLCRKNLCNSSAGLLFSTTLASILFIVAIII
ncbi:hypothetical protein ABEB36_003427 [Hypothenemus hampei]|uniref:Protein quiver n=1 Tax=Hypothenemus hampei TaxID=57062 RepID=A0ABD1F9T8_HYPHA